MSRNPNLPLRQRIAALHLLICLCVPFFALTSSLAVAEEAKSLTANPALEKRVLALTEELRCLVCQNQTIADSHADLAIDLKNQVREQLVQGKSDQAILDYMVERYGDFVLYRPPVKSTTWLLWFGPALLLLSGVSVLAWKVMQRQPVATPLSAADHQRAAALLQPTETVHKDQP